MPSFPKPKFPYTINLSKEIRALHKYRDDISAVKIPAASNKNLRVATWNIANLGAQERQDVHLKIIAEIISWFDVVAVQETKENAEHFEKIVSLAGKNYRFVFSDVAGNNERLAFIYDATKLQLLEEIAELSVPPADYSDIKIAGVSGSFAGFDRNPFIVSFAAGTFLFTLMTVHLYFGTDADPKSINRRCLEAYCVARAADLRANSKYTYRSIKNIFALGDFNLPKIDKEDKIYSALVARGLELPEHTSKVYSNLNNDKQYDQIAFLPGTKSLIQTNGIFPFDNIIFADLFKTKTPAEFRSYVKYYISDHRPMWIEINTKP